MRWTLAVVYLLSGTWLFAWTAVDPVWGVPGFLVLGGWLLYVGVRCARRGEVLPLVRRTGWVFLSIATVGVLLGLWQTNSPSGVPANEMLGRLTSVPFALAGVAAVVAVTSFVGMRLLTSGSTPRGAR
jgi:hypothetical protein